MDRIPLSPVKRSCTSWSQSAIWVAVTSTFLLTGFAPGVEDIRGNVVRKDASEAARAGRLEIQKAGKPKVPPQPAPLLPTAFPVTDEILPTIDRASFDARFFGGMEADPVSAHVMPLDMTTELGGGSMAPPGEVDRTGNARRQRSLHSPIAAFSLVVPTAGELPSETPVDAPMSSQEARPDLLVGVPDGYARLALDIASSEGVDANWVLSVMRAENAGFDPSLVSPAGAIGLMQVMPRIGAAFGAGDLTDPKQNIRAGTRFLRVLIDKYRNPVLVAAAYNAGEPNVDLRHSLPLIRETADYVTRVVGYYTGQSSNPNFPRSDPMSRSAPASRHAAGRVERAKSPMLVFSAAAPIPPDLSPHPEDRQKNAGGPVKIVKKGVFE